MSIRSLAAGTLLGAVVAGAVGIAYAAIPDSSGVIHACYQNVTSANKPVKLLNTSQKATCPSGWSPVAWNQQGVQGPPGTNGVSGYQVVTAIIQITNPGDQAAGPVVADCPQGKVPIGGGYISSNGNFASLYTVQDGPVFTTDSNQNIVGGGWKVYFTSASNLGTTGTITDYAICATIS